MHFNYRSKHKHKKSCFVNARILESFYKKGKKLRKKMKKWQIENSEKSEISEISEKLFRVFLFPSFRFCPVAKIENSDLKISEKNFQVFDLVVQIPLRISSVTSKNIYINNNYTLISANFEAFRCGAYLRAAFKRGRCLCQRKKNYANDTLKLSHCIFPNNNE